MENVENGEQENRIEKKSTREQRVQCHGECGEQEYTESRRIDKVPENGEYSGECGEQEYTKSRRIEKKSKLK